MGVLANAEPRTVGLDCGREGIEVSGGWTNEAGKSIAPAEKVYVGVGVDGEDAAFSF
jgi:hypothetical protein